MEQTVLKQYKPLFLTNKRYYLLIGGRSAGRSYVASQYAYLQLKASQFFRCAIMRYVLSDVRNSIYQEILDRIEEQEDKSITIKDLEFQYKQNTIKGIGFRKSSGDQKSKLKSLAQYNCIIIEEADEIQEEDFLQLDDSLRTVKSDIKVIFMLNPPHKNHWIIKRWFNLLPSDVEGFYNLELKESEKHNTEFIHTTFLNNYQNINETTKDNFERYKLTKPDHYWNMIKGMVSEGARGRIFKNWTPISDKEYEELPYEKFYGLDFGFSCLVGDTLVKTDKGNMRIDRIKKGDMVLTRKGYRRVTWAGSKGVKQVYDIDFGLRKSIIVTGNHRIYTTTGWKEAKDLCKKETICNLKPSYLSKIHTQEDLRESMETIFSATKVDNDLFCTEKFIKNIMEVSLKVLVSTILILTHLITILKIFQQYLFQNTREFTIRTNSVRYQRVGKKNFGHSMDIQNKTGKSVGKKALKQLKKELDNVPNVRQTSRLQTFINYFVDQFAERKLTREIVKKNILAKTVVMLSWLQHTTQETHVLQNVHINSQPLKEKREVFDLTVEDEHEFFANGILVHNCDPTGLLEIKMHNNKVWFRELLYETGLTNQRIAERMRNLGISESSPIYADSAEPKSIQELVEAGFNVLPAVKGQDSINAGIDMLLDKEVYYTEDSQNLATEIQGYVWALDRNKEPTNTPVDKNNHLADCCRYGVYSHAKQGFVGFA
jgi:phage terminase large subunit